MSIKFQEATDQLVGDVGLRKILPLLREINSGSPGVFPKALETAINRLGYDTQEALGFRDT